MEIKYNVKGIYIEVTSKCNLQCKHCYNNSGKKGKDMPIRLLEKVIKEARDMGVKHFTISGGEPFMRDDIIDIVELKSSDFIDDSVDDCIKKNDILQAIGEFVINGLVEEYQSPCNIKM